MATVGIIANPVSGKDIRRLVAHGSVFDNQEKVRIVRRLLTGLEAVGVTRVVYMPDEYAIVPRALQGVEVSLEVEHIAMSVRGNQTDSVNAGRWCAQERVGAVIVLGGDGTCRAVAKENNGKTPMLPISTGTNNVFPYMIEATVGGVAAGLIATGKVPTEAGVYRSCRLEVVVDRTYRDMALVDVAVYNDRFIASRAIWDMDKVSQIFLTRCHPYAIGMSAVGGQLATISPMDPRGMHLALDANGGRKITAPIAPGLLKKVGIRQMDLLEVGRPLAVETAPCVLALDGEREVEVKKGQFAQVRLSEEGPLVIDLKKTMAFAQQKRLMISHG